MLPSATPHPPIRPPQAAAAAPALFRPPRSVQPNQSRIYRVSTSLTPLLSRRSSATAASQMSTPLTVPLVAHLENSYVLVRCRKSRRMATCSSSCLSTSTDKRAAAPGRGAAASHALYTAGSGKTSGSKAGGGKKEGSDASSARRLDRLVLSTGAVPADDAVVDPCGNDGAGVGTWSVPAPDAPPPSAEAAGARAAATPALDDAPAVRPPSPSAYALWPSAPAVPVAAAATAARTAAALRAAASSTIALFGRPCSRPHTQTQISRCRTRRPRRRASFFPRTLVPSGRNRAAPFASTAARRGARVIRNSSPPRSSSSSSAASSRASARTASTSAGPSRPNAFQHRHTRTTFVKTREEGCERGELRWRRVVAVIVQVAPDAADVALHIVVRHEGHLGARRPALPPHVHNRGVQGRSQLRGGGRALPHGGARARQGAPPRGVHQLRQLQEDGKRRVERVAEHGGVDDSSSDQLPKLPQVVYSSPPKIVTSAWWRTEKFASAHTASSHWPPTTATVRSWFDETLRLSRKKVDSRHKALIGQRPASLPPVRPQRMCPMEKSAAINRNGGAEPQGSAPAAGVDALKCLGSFHLGRGSHSERVLDERLEGVPHKRPQAAVDDFLPREHVRDGGQVCPPVREQGRRQRDCEGGQLPPLDGPSVSCKRQDRRRSGGNPGDGGPGDRRLVNGQLERLLHVKGDRQNLEGAAPIEVLQVGLGVHLQRRQRLRVVRHLRVAPLRLGAGVEKEDAPVFVLRHDLLAPATDLNTGAARRAGVLPVGVGGALKAPLLPPSVLVPPYTRRAAATNVVPSQEPPHYRSREEKVADAISLKCDTPLLPQLRACREQMHLREAVLRAQGLSFAQPPKGRPRLPRMPPTSFLSARRRDESDRLNGISTGAIHGKYQVRQSPHALHIIRTARQWPADDPASTLCAAVGGAADCGCTARRVGIGGCRRAGWRLDALHLDDPKSWRLTPAPALAAGGVLAALVALPHQGGPTKIDGGNPTRRLPILTISVTASHTRRTAIAVPDPSIVPTAIVPIAVSNPSIVPTAIVTIAKTVNTVNVLPSALSSAPPPCKAGHDVGGGRQRRATLHGCRDSSRHRLLRGSAAVVVPLNPRPIMVARGC
ncbi:hypothetical protein BU14_0138s0020 [Porphyra umbilicalis]|uniref:Uncharacterized protein n=1 Tax=Porphyra umbilicalis TaxID=2786 RepID=A0A1X6P9Y2_PORUM|nr:hypothetical protein BU14_0138s0020 [Porphyra umbilicalis]|eukprot:OSX77674.1 hypothetical protein BU14_0138s0020 [Porphyra umbilicalis]